MDAGVLRHLDNIPGPRLVSTLAGQSGGSHIGGFADGTGTAARFYGPRAIAVDASGRQIYIAGEMASLAPTNIRAATHFVS